jgi:transcriptional regulator PpsR
MDYDTSEAQRIPFGDSESMFDGFSKDDLIELAYCSGDFLLAIDESNIIRDVAINSKESQLASHWIGRKWVDTVTIESQPKVSQMLDCNGGPETSWRQVNHHQDGDDIPVKYRLIRPRNGPWTIAVGRDLRTISMLQQRLLKTQQSMERDYLNLRQTETRYRLLFDNISYPVFIVDAANLEIEQANWALHTLVNAAPGSLDGKSFIGLVDDACRDSLVAYIGAATVSDSPDGVEIRLAGQENSIRLSISAFRQSGKKYLLVNLDDGEREMPTKPSDRYVLDAVEKMPDAFVLANEKQEIVVTNLAFAELVQAGSIEQLIGVSLNRFVGRPDIDLNLLRNQLKDHQDVRNFSSIVIDLNGSEEPVEISAIMIERDMPLFGYSVRTIGRRERDLPKSDQELRSVDQLTELVGRKPLKEIVRESTDLIERMCIEAALIHTSDNRASAAEILGLSRQSLYSKLHRHGLGNLSDKE